MADVVRKRLVGFLALFVVLALGAAASFAGSTVNQSIPERSGAVTLEGLSAEVEVVRDAHGVPQIYADTAEDLFAAQGYVHAQDRFWEMDVRRHITAGRLSELFGESQLETDAYIRTMGWRRVAEEEVGLLSAEARTQLDAYANGVNAYLSSRDTQDLSLEYSIIGLNGKVARPEPWTPADSLAWLKAMAWDLDGNKTQEIELAVVADRVGMERAKELYPAYDLDARLPIVINGELRGEKFTTSTGDRRVAVQPAAGARAEKAAWSGAESALQATAKMSEAIPPLVAAEHPGEVGSNSWAISGERTATGKAMLSNDPHLATSIPSIFAQMGLHCRTVNKACAYDVSGFTFSGMPGVVIGHNADIAWGFTTPYLDTQDLFIEQVDEQNRVRRGERWEPLSIRTEKIAVQGEDEPREITVRTSSHGPLMSDVDGAMGGVAERERAKGDGTAQYAVAMSWTALTPTPSMEAIFALNQAEDFTQFRAAAKLLRAPSQNLMYADVEGNIGYQLPGDVPVRKNGRDGLTPTQGWDPANDWSATIPYEELPYAYNPPDGVIVAANQTIVGEQYPRLLGPKGPSYGWRSQRIRDRLAALDDVTLDQGEELFYDTSVTYAQAMVPAMLRAPALEAWVIEGQSALLAWDGHADADSAGAAYYYLVVDNLLKRTFRDELPVQAWPESGDRWYAVLQTLLQDRTNPWWDDVTTNKVETSDDIMALALLDARREITARMSRDVDGWEWGKLHRLSLTHQTLGTSGIGPVEAMFNRGGFASGGGPAVVDAMSFRSTAEGNYHVTNGPAMRMLIDLGELDDSRWVNQSGASGHAFSDTYDDQLELWATNRMWKFAFTEAAVRQAGVETLRLRPTT